MPAKDQTDGSKDEAPETKKQENDIFGDAKITDLALVYFTYCLAVVGWVTIRSGERNTKIIERAYLFPDLLNRECFQIDATPMTLQARFRNTGKTPAIAYESQIQGGDRLPDVRTYDRPGGPLSIHVIFPAGGTDFSGTARFSDDPPKAFWGYLKYRNIFGDECTTGFACAIHETRGQC